LVKAIDVIVAALSVRRRLAHQLLIKAIDVSGVAWRYVGAGAALSRLNVMAIDDGRQGRDSLERVVRGRQRAGGEQGYRKAESESRGHPRSPFMALWCVLEAEVLVSARDVM
jgi:hypothetical protein